MGLNLNRCSFCANKLVVGERVAVVRSERYMMEKHRGQVYLGVVKSIVEERGCTGRLFQEVNVQLDIASAVRADRNYVRMIYYAENKPNFEFWHIERVGEPVTSEAKEEVGSAV